MIFKKNRMKLKLSDNFAILDNVMMKVLMICISIFIIFNTFNFIVKGNNLNASIFKSLGKKIENNITPSILNDGNIKFYLYEEMPNMEKEDVYHEVIYFSQKKDIGMLVNKAKDLINNSSINVKNKYIEVKIKQYDKSEEIATVLWNRDNKNEYIVYTK